MTNKKTTTKNSASTKPTTKDISTTILEQRIKNLEDALAKMAHMTGQERVLKEFGLTPWQPSKNDMRKYKN